MNAITPAIENEGEVEVVWTHSERRGGSCILPGVNRRAALSVQTLLEHSLPVYGS